MPKLKRKLTAEEFNKLSKDMRAFYTKEGDAYLLQTDEQEVIISVNKVEDLEINNPEIVLETPDRDDGRLGIGIERIESLLSIFQGPLPPPEQLAEYNNAFPNGAEKIFDLTDGEAKHRRNLESWETKGDIIRSFAGVVAGLIISLFGFYISWDLASKNHEWVAGVIAVTDLTALVTVFIYGTRTIKNIKEKDNTEQTEKSLVKSENSPEN